MIRDHSTSNKSHFLIFTESSPHMQKRMKQIAAAHAYRDAYFANLWLRFEYSFACFASGRFANYLSIISPWCVAWFCFAWQRCLPCAPSASELPMSTRQKARVARGRVSKTKMTSRASKNSMRRIATIGQTAHGADFHGMVAAANASDAGQEW